MAKFLPPTPTNLQPTTCSPAAVGQTQLASGYGTITTGQNNTGGGLYTAPSVIPSVNPFLVAATSTVDTTAFGSAMVTLRTGAEVHITPSTATVASGDNFQFTANVTGTTNTNVTWEVGGVAGGTASDGYICPSSQITVPCTAGEYFAPASGCRLGNDYRGFRVRSVGKRNCYCNRCVLGCPDAHFFNAEHRGRRVAAAGRLSCRNKFQFE